MIQLSKKDLRKLKTLLQSLIEYKENQKNCATYYYYLSHKDEIRVNRITKKLVIQNKFVPNPFSLLFPLNKDRFQSYSLFKEAFSAFFNQELFKSTVIFLELKNKVILNGLSTDYFEFFEDNIFLSNYLISKKLFHHFYVNNIN